MVAVVSGNGLGLLNGSLGVLGGQGSVGSSSQGRLGESVFVNAATGNLIVSHLDDAIISGRGTNGLARTYNSKGMTDADGDNNDGWRIGVYRKIGPLVGGTNVVDSTVQKTESDGSVTTFTYDSFLSLYVSKAGGGAYNTMRYTGGATWIYQDGDTQSTETYGLISQGGLLLSETDLDGNTTSYTYGGTTGKLITAITTQNVKNAITEKINLNYTGVLLDNITFNGANDAGVDTSSRRVAYAYDTNSRLKRVTVDLSPDDLSIADGKFYSTNYTYYADGRLWTMTQTDGTSLTFTYDANGRVATVKDALNRTTTYDYSVADKLTITDALALQTVITFETAAGNSNGYIKTIKYPSAQLVTYTYTTNGDIASVNDNYGQISYSYDARGNLLQQWDAAGNTVSYTYDGANRKVSETHYTGIDADGAGTTYQASGAQTTRYVYDASNKGHLRFSISAEGRVTERVYSNVTGRKGALTSSISYNAALYTTAGTPTEDNLKTWVAGIDKSQGQRTDYVYDWRGQVSTSTQYVNLNADGTGNTSVAANVSTTTYIYDARGQLLKTIDANLNPTIYAYDGMGRVIGSTNALIQSSVTSYDDANKKVTVDYANGRKVVSTFDAAGQLTSVMESDSGLTDLGTTKYYYDANGNERMRVDATGQRFFKIYNGTGRKIGEIDSAGVVTLYSYFVNGLLRQVISQVNPLSSQAFVLGGPNSLLNLDGTPSALALATNTISTLSSVNFFDSNDTETLLDAEQDQAVLNLYDAAGRLSKTLSSIVYTNSLQQSYMTEYQYDGSNRLIKTIHYSTPVMTGPTAANGVTVNKFTKSTDVPSPALTSADRITRTFYDNDGLKRGDLDAEGYLTEYQHDNLGRLNHSIRYANATDINQRANGTLASLIPATSTQDQHSYTLYDSQGRVTGGIDAEGYLTEYVYDKVGNKTKTTKYTDKLWTDGGVGYFAARRLTVNDQGYPDRRYWKDITGDGKLDYVRAIGNWSGSGSYQGVSYFQSAGVAYDYSSSSPTYDWGASDRRWWIDINGDKRADYARSIEGGDLLISKSDGVGLQSDAASARFALYDWGYGDRRWWVDMNGDGKSDYVRAVGSGGGANSYLRVSLSDGNTLSQESNVDSPLANWGFNDRRWWVDINGDGKSDYVRAVGSEYGEGSQLGVSLSNGVGLEQEYSSLTDVWDWGYSDSRSWNDIDGDGKSDYSRIIGNRSGANSFIQVTYSNGVGLGSTQVASIEKFGYINRFFWGDIDGDKIKDLVGINSNGIYWSRFKNGQLEDPILAVKATDFPGYNPDTVTVEDINGDGVSDFVSTSAQGMYLVQSAKAPVKGLTLNQLKEGFNSSSVTTTNTYDALNRLSTETSVDGTVTQYLYNNGGQVESKTVALGAVEPHSVARSTSYTYDLDGQLKTVTQAEGGVSTNYYDSANRLIKSVTANGLDANGNASKDSITLYYYGTTYTAETPNATPRLYNYTVDALGYVTRTSTNPLGQVTETRKSAKAITDTAFLTAISNGSATGGIITSGAAITTTLNSAFDLLNPNSLDQRSTTTYTINGLVQAVQDAFGNTTTYQTYNAFGQATQIDQVLGDGTGRTVSSKYEYDHRGSATKTYSDTTGFNLLTQASYDAFGRVISTTDAANNTRTTQYDRLGRTLQITDALTNSRSLTYDAFGRVLTQSDAYGNKTLTSYDDVNRMVTVTSPEGVITTTTKTRHGQTLSIQVGSNPATSYSYDKNGNLKQITNADGTTQKSDFDAGNRQIASYDGNSVKTTYSYDAINRVTHRIVDPTGLAITSSTSYSGTDNTVTQTDTNGVVTTTTFDAKGRAVLIKVAAGTADEIATKITYDAAGNKLTVIEGADINGNIVAGANGSKVTDYVYDTLGRRTQETVRNINADTGITTDLVTKYSYDANGNVIDKTDASGAVTRYVYDVENRLKYSIDALGNVSESTYDNNNRVIGSCQYATPINLALLPAVGTKLALTDISSKITPSTGFDHLTQLAYNKDGREVLSLDAKNQLSRKDYDAAGNLARVTRYATPVAAGTTLTSTTSVATSPRDQLTHYVYDKLGRLVYTLDDVGSVSRRQYDNAGQVVANWSYAVAYSAALPADGIISLATMDSFAAANASTARLSRMAYDNAGRLIFTLDTMNTSQGALTKYSYQGNLLVQTLRYATSVDLSTLPGLFTDTYTGFTSSFSAYSASSQDQETRTVYDNVGRKKFVFTRLDSLNRYAVTQWNYDDLNRNFATRQYSTAINAAEMPASLTMDNVIALLSTRIVDSQDRRSKKVFDAAGQLILSKEIIDFTDPVTGVTTTQEAVTRREYDGAGHLVREYRYAKPIALNAVLSATALPAASADDQVTDYVYDAAGQLRYSIDPDGYVTENRYDAFGHVTEKFRWNAQLDSTRSINGIARVSNGRVDLSQVNAWALQLGSFLTGKTSTYEALSYDGVGNLVHYTQSTNATSNNNEHYDYDTFGRKIAYTNAKGYTWNYVYDDVGRLLYEISPQVDMTTSSGNAAGAVNVGTTQQLRFITQNQYNTFGHVITRTEGSANFDFTTNTLSGGWVESRKTEYEYDLLGHQKGIKNPGYDAYNGETATQLKTAGATRSAFESNLTPQVSTEYNALGQAIRNTAHARNDKVQAVGDKVTVKIYNNAGQVQYDIDSEGYVTGYGYDALGNQTQLIRYATQIAAINGVAFQSLNQAPTLSDINAWVAANQQASQDRTLTTHYTRAGKADVVTEMASFVVDTNASVDAPVGYSAAKQLVSGYDAFGNVVRINNIASTQNTVTTTDDKWDTTRVWYDHRGNKIAQFDAGGFLTRYSYDHRGNLISQIEFPNAIAANQQDAMVFANISTTDARQTDYEYDHLNRKTVEIIKNVAYSTANTDTNSVVENLVGDAKTLFTYDEVGNLTKKTEEDANGVKRIMQDVTYDALGRSTVIIEPKHESKADAITPSNVVSMQPNVTLNSMSEIDHTITLNVSDFTAFGDGAITFVVDVEFSGMSYPGNTGIQPWSSTEKITYTLPEKGAGLYTLKFKSGFASSTPVVTVVKNVRVSKAIDGESRLIHTAAPGLGARQLVITAPTGGVTAKLVLPVGTKLKASPFTGVTTLSGTRMGDRQTFDISILDIPTTLDSQGRDVFAYSLVYEKAGAEVSTGTGIMLSAPGGGIATTAQTMSSNAGDQNLQAVTMVKYNAFGFAVQQKRIGTSATIAGYPFGSPNVQLTAANGGNPIKTYSASGTVGWTASDGAGKNKTVRIYYSASVPGLSSMTYQTGYVDVTAAVGDTVANYSLSFYGTDTPSVTITKVEVALSDDQIVRNTYDALGHKLQQTNEVGVNIYSSYNQLGQLAREWRIQTDADDRQQLAITQYQYDERGKQIAVVERVNARGLDRITEAPLVALSTAPNVYTIYQSNGLPDSSGSKLGLNYSLFQGFDKLRIEGPNVTTKTINLDTPQGSDLFIYGLTTTGDYTVSVMLQTIDGTENWTQVYKKTAGVSSFPQSMIWRAPAEPNVEVQFRWKKDTDTSWGASIITPAGGVCSVNLSSLGLVLTQNYQYEIVYSRKSTNTVYAHQSGNFALASNSAPIINVTTGSASSLVSTALLNGSFARTATIDQATQVVKQQTHINAFGEIDAKGVVDAETAQTTPVTWNRANWATQKEQGWSEFYDYDQAGHLWRNHQKDGIVRVDLYGLNGAVTQSIQAAAGTELDLANSASYANAAAVYNAAVATTSAYQRTTTRYNALGQMIEQRKPETTSINREAITDVPSASNLGYVAAVISYGSGPLYTSKATVTWDALTGFPSVADGYYVEIEYFPYNQGSTPRTKKVFFTDPATTSSTTIDSLYSTVAQTFPGAPPPVQTNIYVRRIGVYRTSDNKALRLRTETADQYKEYGNWSSTGSGKLLTFTRPALRNNMAALLRYRTNGSTGPWTVVQLPVQATSNALYFDLSVRPALAAGTFSYELYYYQLGDETSDLTTLIGPSSTANAQAWAWTRGTFNTTVGSESVTSEGVSNAAALTTSTSTTIKPGVTQVNDRWGNVLSDTDITNSQTVSYSYNRYNKRTRLNLPITSVTSFDSSLIKNTTGGDRSSDSYYDAFGRQVGERDANGNLHTYQYDSAGTLRAESGEEGQRLSYRNDAFGRRIQKTLAWNRTINNVSVAESQITTYSYDGLDRLVTSTEIDGALQTYAYDEFGNRKKVTNGVGDMSKTWYDSRGQVIRSVDAAKFETNSYFDLAGHKIRETNANLDSQTWAYNGVGQLTSRSLLERNNAGTQRLISSAYFASGQLKTETYDQDASAAHYFRTRQYSYFNNGLLKQVDDRIGIPGSGGGATTWLSDSLNYSYDQQGRQTREYYNRADGSRYDTLTRYDVLGRITQITDGYSKVNYEYDRTGNRTRVQNTTWDNAVTPLAKSKVGDEYYAYDKLNRVTMAKAALDSNTNKLVLNATQGERYVYDGAGNRVEQVNLFLTDPNNAQSAVKTRVSRYDFATNGIVSGNGIASINVGEALGSDSNAEDTARANTATAPTFKQQRKYDAAGRLTEQTETKTVKMTYVNGRMTKTEQFNGSTLEFKTTTTRDAVGNTLKALSTGNNTTDFTRTQYKRADSYREVATERFATGGANQIGNTTTNYDARGQITSVRDVQATTTRSFVTDFNGMIRSKTSQKDGQTAKTQRYVYANNQLAGSFGEIDTTARFDPGVSIDASSLQGSPSQYVVNLGDTLQRIAQTVYGDSSRWYLIAEANGLSVSSTDTLTAGQTLLMPKLSSVNYNTSSSFKPYNPQAIIGDTTPTLSAPPKPLCSKEVATLIAVVIAVIITVISWGTLSGVSYAVASAIVGAAISVSTQLVMMTAGYQDKFSWKQVAVAAVSSYLTAGLPAGGGVGGAIGRGIASNVINQGLSIAVGIQKEFDWKGVALSAAQSAINYGVGEMIGEANLKSDNPSTRLTSIVGRNLLQNTIGQGLKSLVYNTGKMDWTAVATDTFQNSIADNHAYQVEADYWAKYDPTAAPKAMSAGLGRQLDVANMQAPQQRAVAANTGGGTNQTPGFVEDDSPADPRYQDPTAAGRAQYSADMSKLASKNEASYKFRKYMDDHKANSFPTGKPEPSMYDYFMRNPYAEQAKADMRAYVSEYKAQLAKQAALANTTRPMIYDQKPAETPLTAIANQANANNPIRKLLAWQNQAPLAGGGIPYREFKQLSAVDAFFGFNKFGRVLSGAGHTIKDTLYMPVTFNVGLYHLVRDGIGYGSDAVFGPTQGLMMKEKYVPTSSIVKSFQEHGALGATGGFVRNTVMNLPGVGLVNAMYRNDYEGMGSGLVNTALGAAPMFMKGPMIEPFDSSYRVLSDSSAASYMMRARGGVANSLGNAGDLVNAPNYVSLLSNFKKMPTSEVNNFYSNMEGLGVNYQDLVGHAIKNYGMTTDEAHAVFGYTTKLFYRDLNGALKTGGNADATALSDLINSGLDKMPSSGPVQYRGWRLDDPGSLSQFDFNYQVGNTVTSNFWSASPKQADAYFATRNAVIYTDSAKDISDLAFGVNFHNKIGKPVYSSETLIPPGLEFKVTGVDSNGWLILEQQ